MSYVVCSVLRFIEWVYVCVECLRTCPRACMPQASADALARALGRGWADARRARACASVRATRGKWFQTQSIRPHSSQVECVCSIALPASAVCLSD